MRNFLIFAALSEGAGAFLICKIPYLGASSGELSSCPQPAAAG